MLRVLCRRWPRAPGHASTGPFLRHAASQVSPSRGSRSAEASREDGSDSADQVLDVSHQSLLSARVLQRLASMRLRAREVEQALSSASTDAARVTVLSKEAAALGPVVALYDQLCALSDELHQLDELEHEALGDSEMLSQVVTSRREALGAIVDVERGILQALLPQDTADRRSGILEVRAGVGGKEAALFAAELLLMYQRYAVSQRWRTSTLSESRDDSGGLREAVINVTGKGVFGRLKFESGVHRVQRVPLTESNGRVHTSTATVAVLPEAEAVDVQVDEKDLRIDVFRASGAGGQHVNKTESAVRITHIPTGVVVSSQEERSQHQNKARCMKVLRSRLFEEQRRRIAAKRTAARSQLIGTGDRSERVRTYNVPQNRITDHRIGKTVHDVDRMLRGEHLDELLDLLVVQDQADALAALDQQAE